MKRSAPKAPPSVVRCAVYTRKSTEEGLDQEFNTLDAQRESGEAYITSQKHDGWICLPDHYDDGGFTGGNMDRPALRRLFADIEAGKIDAVIVYKVDRLSRSLLDFARMMEIFDRHQVSFVSVTQQFNTSISMGRLTLNMLLSFAQFEREMISERTRDKIAATRRKGKYSGGMPLLGYDVVDKKLVVVDSEAEQVRQIFGLYLECGSLIRTCAELSRRGWTTKVWTTKKGISRGGEPFQKNRLHHLLTNVTYIGKIRYKDEVHEGEHPGIVEPDAFNRVQEQLSGNGHGTSGGHNAKHTALLKGILRCATCDCGMTHTYTAKGSRRYRYYVCDRAQQRGKECCPAGRVSAPKIERFVVDEIRCIGRDPALVAATVAEARRQTDEAIQRLKQERAALERQRRVDAAEAGRLGEVNGAGAALSKVTQRDSDAVRRLADIRDELARLAAAIPTAEDVADALATFDGVWDALTPREQAAILCQLIEGVAFDSVAEEIEIAFRATRLLRQGNHAAIGEDAAA